MQFEVDLPFIQASHCHCDRCGKHSGTAVCTQARVLREQFRLLQGMELIKVYGKGDSTVKAFCSNCGSSLFGGDGPQVSIRMGAFDDDPWVRPEINNNGHPTNFILSSPIARRGIRSLMIFRSIRNDKRENS
ncbi:MAG TPA: GFA family protein [Candidatus Udaeobacter sp.]|nr:GFA family protein [Candidatus Udaeobacter sp.]